MTMSKPEDVKALPGVPMTDALRKELRSIDRDLPETKKAELRQAAFTRARAAQAA